MNINELLVDHQPHSLPMRAWLTPEEHTTPGKPSGGWTLADFWPADEEPPRLYVASLHLLELDEMRCLAVVGHAGTPREGQVTGGDERAVVYLLNPADHCAWDAIDSWRDNGLRVVHTRNGTDDLVAAPMAEDAPDFHEFRDIEGDELASDLLAGELKDLMFLGRLELLLAAKLGLQKLPYCAIVETPMMCNSMAPVDPRVWRAHLDHLYNKWRHEGIWS